MGRRKWTAEQKMSIVLQGIKGETSVAEICRNHGISQVQYYKWRDLFFEGAKQKLDGKSNSNNYVVYKERIKELERIIGKQTVTIEILKKIQELPDH
jgi:putative transposase